MRTGYLRFSIHVHVPLHINMHMHMRVYVGVRVYNKESEILYNGYGLFT